MPADPTLSLRPVDDRNAEEKQDHLKVPSGTTSPIVPIAVAARAASGHETYRHPITTMPEPTVHHTALPDLVVDEETGIGTYGKVPKIPTGEFRTPLFDCWKFPHCLVAWCCPFLIWAQAHKFLHGGTHPIRGMRGYYAIIGVFTVLAFISASAGSYQNFAFFEAIVDLMYVLGVLVMCSLFRHVRLVYGIRGNLCGNFCCGSCSDGCDDVLKSACCPCCATYQLGNHLFHYNENVFVTYEPIPTVLQVQHRDHTIV